MTLPAEVQQQQQPQLQTPIVAQVLIKSWFNHLLFDKEKYSVSYRYWQNSESPIITVSLYLQLQTLVYFSFINTVETLLSETKEDESIFDLQNFGQKLILNFKVKQFRKLKNVVIKPLK